MSGKLQRNASIAFPAPAAPELPAEALERLPRVDGDVDPYWRLVTAFWWLSAAFFGVHPLAARRHHVDAWVRHLSQNRPADDGPAGVDRLVSRAKVGSVLSDQLISLCPFPKRHSAGS